MAYSVDKNILIDGPRHHIVRCTAISDGTLTAGQDVLIDISTLKGPLPDRAPNRLAVEELWYSVQGYEAIALYWDHASQDTLIAVLSGDGYQDFREYGGLPDDGSTGTGDIIWAYAGGGSDTAGDTFTITIKAKKKL